MVAIGEIGLTGEVRQAPRVELRLAEAKRLGFTRAIVGGSNAAKLATPGLDVVPVATIRAAIEAAL